MRGNELLDQMELVDPAYVEKADASPEKKKRIRWGAIAAILCLVLGGLVLWSVFLSGDIIYRDGTVTVKEVTLSDEKQQKHMEWLNLTPADYFSDPLIIATGKITNLRDVEVTYTKDGEKRTETMALFDFEVTEYLLNSTETESKPVLTVGCPHEANLVLLDVPVLENGKEFLLFLRQPSYWKPDAEDVMKRASFMDVHIYGEYSLTCEKVDGAYIVAPNLRMHFAGVEKAAVTEDMRRAVAERGAERAYVFAIKAETAEKIIKEAAEAYSKG